MKAKLWMILLAGMLLTGCGKSENNQENGGNSTENASQEENVEKDSEEDSEEEEPYVLSFEAVTVEGEEMDASCFSDSKLTMINIWATYCNPCLSEMPDLGEIATSYDSTEFQVIGIISDVAEGADESDLKEAKELIEETKADYPQLLLSESLYSNLVGAIDSVPTTFFVNQKGEVLGYVIGARSKESWEEIINEVMAELP